MIFDGFADLLRVVFVGLFAYIALIVLLRISGKRTLSQMNAFDFVVTVALGSILATVMLSKGTSFIEGMAAFGMLIFLQYVMSYASVRSKTVKDLIRGEPSLLFHKGEFMVGTLKKERLTQDEVRQAMRQHGVNSYEDVEAVVLETNGSLSIIGSSSGDKTTVLDGVTGI